MIHPSKIRGASRFSLPVYRGGIEPCGGGCDSAVGAARVSRGTPCPESARNVTPTRLLLNGTICSRILKCCADDASPAGGHGNRCAELSNRAWRTSHLEIQIRERVRRSTSHLGSAIPLHRGSLIPGRSHSLVANDRSRFSRLRNGPGPRSRPKWRTHAPASFRRRVESPE